MHWWLLHVWLGEPYSDEGRAERERIDDYLSAEVRPKDEELPKHGIKPPSFWRGPATGEIEITNVEALAAAMRGRRG